MEKEKAMNKKGKPETIDEISKAIAEQLMTNPSDLPLVDRMKDNPGEIPADVSLDILVRNITPITSGDPSYKDLASMAHDLSKHLWIKTWPKYIPSEKEIEKWVKVGVKHG